MTSRSLVIFKPDACERMLCSALKVILQNHGFRIQRYTPRVLSPDELAAHYCEHVTKKWFTRLVSGMVWQPAVTMIAEALDLPAVGVKDPIRYLRDLIGPVGTMDLLTIRGMFRDPGAAPHQNVIHASDSAKAAEREILIFYPDEILLDT